MTLPATPEKADNIITFGGNATSKAAVINYDVSLPGSYTGKRIIRLDLGLNTGDFLETPKTNVGLPALDNLQWTKQNDRWTYNSSAAFEYFMNSLHENGIENYTVLLNTWWVAGHLLDEQGLLKVPEDGLPSGFGHPDLTKVVWQYYMQFAEGLKNGQLVRLILGWDGRQFQTVVTPAETALRRQVDTIDLCVVETYAISSFFGDYGLGKTVRTFTLLPGEETKISIKTWRSSTRRIEEASSIIDSYTTDAASRFTTSVQRETTDKRTRNSKEAWQAEAEVTAQWGWGNAKVNGGAAGEYQEGREEFCKQVQDAVSEHANQSSSARDTSVTSTSEQTEETGDETMTERTIRNVNLRRVLNFVFRELNQQYITKVHLIDIAIAYTTGAPDSWREAPISGLRGLLEEILVPDKINEVALNILAVIGRVMNINDMPVATLDCLEIQPDGTYKVANALRTDAQTGRLLPPPADRSFLYRFKRGPIGQTEVEKPVNGVLLKEVPITMRTESLVIEALLGQADALDNYATAAQMAEVQAKQFENERMALALDTLKAIEDPKERAAAYASMFNAPTVQTT